MPVERLEAHTDPAPLAVGAKRLAAMLDVSERQIHVLNCSGRLPKPVRIGARAIRWPVDELRAWLAAGAPDRATWDVLKRDGVRRP